jgi:hypothetical protein
MVHDTVAPGRSDEGDLHARVLLRIAPGMPQVRVTALPVNVEAHTDGVMDIEEPRNVCVDFLPAAVSPLVVVRERDVLVVALDHEAVVPALPVLNGPSVYAEVATLLDDEAVTLDGDNALGRVEIRPRQAVVAPAIATRMRFTTARPDVRVCTHEAHLKPRVSAMLVPRVPEVRVATVMLGMHAHAHGVTDLKGPVHVQPLLVPAALAVAVVVRDGNVLVVTLQHEAVVAALAMLVEVDVEAIETALEDVHTVALDGELVLRRAEIGARQAVGPPSAAAAVLGAAAGPHGHRAKPVHLQARVLALGAPRVPQVGVSALLVCVVSHAHRVARRKEPSDVGADLVPASLIPVKVLAHGDVLVVLLQRDRVLTALPVLYGPRIDTI